jgi:pSer/pThr/pTyr-binding forkhead associated (FHA) protein
VRLVIEDGAGTRTVVPFTGDELVLGRTPPARGGWRLPERNVSRRHARFTRSGGAVHVEDLGSRTGTWLNGERLSGRRRLRVGDLVEIGGYDLVVLPDQAEAAGPGSPPPLPVTPLPAAAAVAPAGAADPAPGRAARRRLVLWAGVVGLLGGLVAGLLLARR